MDYEFNRYTSFLTTKLQGLDPTKLARTGFYVVKVAKDKAILQCQFCTTSISQWTTSDDEIIVHKTYAPWCPIITQQPCNNVPLDKNLLQQATDPVQPQYQPTTIEHIETTPEEEQRNRRRYQNHITRKASFQRAEPHYKHSINGLTAAGFYYSQEATTRCYRCSLTIMNWNKRCEPWQLHMALSPQCEHITRIIDKHLIQQTVKHKEQLMQYMLTPDKKEENPTTNNPMIQEDELDEIISTLHIEPDTDLNDLMEIIFGDDSIHVSDQQIIGTTQHSETENDYNIQESVNNEHQTQQQIHSNQKQPQNGETTNTNLGEASQQLPQHSGTLSINRKRSTHPYKLPPIEIFTIEYSANAYFTNITQTQQRLQIRTDARRQWKIMKTIHQEKYKRLTINNTNNIRTKPNKTKVLAKLPSLKPAHVWYHEIATERGIEPKSWLHLNTIEKTVFTQIANMDYNSKIIQYFQTKLDEADYQLYLNNGRITITRTDPSYKPQWIYQDIQHIITMTIARIGNKIFIEDK